MVGDGINDSPALSAADVSVAMRNSSDIAREVADISLLSDDLHDLVTLRKLSTGMLDKINSNYRHIVMFNGSLIGLGLLGLIPPTTTSLLHNLSTMLFGIRSTKTVLGEDEQFIIDTQALNNDNTLIGASAKWNLKKAYVNTIDWFLYIYIFLFLIIFYYFIFMN